MKLGSRTKAKLRRKAKYWASRQELDEWVGLYRLLLSAAINEKRKR